MVQTSQGYCAHHTICTCNKQHCGVQQGVQSNHPSWEQTFCVNAPQPTMTCTHPLTTKLWQDPGSMTSSLSPKQFILGPQLAISQAAHNAPQCQHGFLPCSAQNDVCIIRHQNPPGSAALICRAHSSWLSSSKNLPPVLCCAALAGAQSC
jgi:hypothetical protein